jgi:hypothetical protein
MCRFVLTVVCVITGVSVSVVNTQRLPAEEERLLVYLRRSNKMVSTINSKKCAVEMMLNYLHYLTL